MRYHHANRVLSRIDSETNYVASFSPNLVRAFRMRMQMIRDADSIQTFYALKSLHFEKLKGVRSHQHSMRLNRQFRLIVEIHNEAEGQTVVVIAIEDYH